MAFIYTDRVQEKTTSTGTDDLVLGGAPDSSCRKFGDVMANGDTTDISVFGGGQFETCRATYNSSLDKLVRGTIYASSNGNARVNFTAGEKTIVMSMPGQIGARLENWFTSSIINNTVLPTRLREVAATVTDWNDAVANGVYMGNAAANEPPTVSGASWAIGYVEVHNTNYVVQTVSRFQVTDANNTNLWRRKKNSGTWGAWYRLRISETELDARYGAALVPQGRLTLQSGVPVMTTTQAGKTTIYYEPYVGAFIPIYDGTRFGSVPFTALSNVTTDTTKNPAAVAANKIYDLFVWNDNGTLRLSRGPAWTDDETRALALVTVGGIDLNAVGITNGPAASRGIWVGTVRSNASSQIDWILSGAGAVLGVYNAYNRVPVFASNGFTAARTTTSTSWIELHNEIRIAAVVGRPTVMDGALVGYGSIGADVGLLSVEVDGNTSPTRAAQMYAANQLPFVGGPLLVPIGYHYMTLMVRTNAGGSLGINTSGVTPDTQLVISGDM